MKPAFLSMLILLACLGIAEAAFLPHIVIHNTGTLTIPSATTVTFTIYNDTGLKIHANLAGIGPRAFGFSSIYADCGYYPTVYGVITVNKTANVTLHVYAENFNPQTAVDWMTLYAYRNISSYEVTDLNGTTLQVDSLHPTVMEISLTLCISLEPVPPSTPFPAFDITFTAKAEP